MKYLKVVTMIDTVKLVVPFSSQPRWVTDAKLFHKIDNTKGVFVAYNNPSTAYKKLGIYQPRLTYTERPRGNYRKDRQLSIEFSAPKLLFSNNFTELKDDSPSLLPDFHLRVGQCRPIIDLLTYLKPSTPLQDPDTPFRSNRI